MNPQLENPKASETGRRTFLGRALVLLSGVAVWRPNLATHTSLQTTAAKARLEGSETGGASVPEPTYLPPGYRFLTRYKDRPDGFGGGPNEVALWYVAAQYSDAMTFPLGVYLAANPTREFTGMADHAGEIVSLKSPSLTDVVYHNGNWVREDVNPDRTLPNGVGLRWESGTVNSVTARLGEFVVGIRGAKSHGVDRPQLLLILQSMVKP